MALLIDNRISHQVLGPLEARTAVREALEREARGAAVNRRGIVHTQLPADVPGDWHRFRITDGAVEDLGVAVVRINSQVVTFTGRSQDWYADRPGRFCGLILLYSTHTGKLLAILQDGHIQHHRVASMSLIGAECLARPDSRRLCILGSQAMALAHARAALVTFPIEEIRVYSPTPANRQRLGAELAKTTGRSIVVCDEAEAAVHGADIVMSCTSSVQPVLEWDWVSPGTHISAVTGPLELGPKLFPRFDVYASHHPTINDGLIVSAEGEVPLSTGGAPQPGRGHPEAAVAESARRDLHAIIRGEQQGRSNDQEISGFWASGTAAPVAAMALAVYETATAQGLGQEMPDDWFLEDERD